MGTIRRPTRVCTTARVARIAAATALTVCVTACSGEKGRSRGRAAGGPLPAPEGAGGAAAGASFFWDSAAGPALILAADSVPDSVSVIRPEYVEGRYTDTSVADVRLLSHTRFDLFGRGGAFGSATVTAGPPGVPGSSEEGCVSWPVAALTSAKAGWNVGVRAGAATAVPLDSIEAMSASDSALFAAQVARIATILSGTRDPVFNNIPFVVQNAYRFRTTLVEGIIGATQRSIPSEATPREEHLFFVAERPVGSSSDYRVAFSTRTAGEEGSAAVMNVLALVVLNQGDRPALIVSDEYEDGGAVAVIERTDPGHWRMIWRSAYAGC